MDIFFVSQLVYQKLMNIYLQWVQTENITSIFWEPICTGSLQPTLPCKWVLSPSGTKYEIKYLSNACNNSLKTLPETKTVQAYSWSQWPYIQSHFSIGRHVLGWKTINTPCWFFHLSAAPLIKYQSTKDICKYVTNLWSFSYMGPLTFYILIQEATIYRNKWRITNTTADLITLMEAPIESPTRYVRLRGITHQLVQILIR